MYKLSDIEDAVTSRVADQIGSNVLDVYINRHKKGAWRYCDCDYCVTKRNATTAIGNAVDISHHIIEKDRYVRHVCHTTFRALILDTLTSKEYTVKGLAREMARAKYRKKLEAEEQKLC